jgi:hypothetical protein
LTNEKILKVQNYEESDLSEREKVALRYADKLKFDPQGVNDQLIEDLKTHFSDAEICEMGYIMMAYGGAHNFLSSIGEEVLDENGVNLEGRGGFPIVFHTMDGRSEYQSEAESAPDGPLPAHAQSAKGER